MFKVAILSLFVLAVAARELLNSHTPEFVSFIREYKKDYCSETGVWPCEESIKREAIFQDNLAKIEAHNSRNDVTYTMGVNQLADLTNEEFKAQYLGFKASNEARAPTPFRYAEADAPASVDWRTKGAVTHVKNQEQCGSCWAFSAVGAIEGIHKITTGKLNTKVGFSEQELVSCDKVDAGCGGGLMDNAFTYVQKNGLVTETAYPYTGTQDACNSGVITPAHVKISGHEDVPSMNEPALMKAVANQPVSVAIEADQSGFQLYKEGIFTGPCGTALDHGVLVVGYDTTGDMPYWIIKNSWGETWGDSGFIKMVMNQNMCGIAQQPSYPTMDSETQ